MKRYIRCSEYILGMSYNRQQILDAAYRNSSKIQEHILKCIIYSKDYPDYNHWVDEEIAVWISNVNNMKSKRGFKIKDKDYINNLFSAFGDELSDAKREVENFHRTFVENHPDPYPDFNIVRQLYSTYYHAWNDIKDYLYGNVGRYPVDTARNDISRLLHQILDNYCKSSPWLK